MLASFRITRKYIRPFSAPTAKSCMGTREVTRYVTPVTLTWTMECVLLNESVLRPASYSRSRTQNLTAWPSVTAAPFHFHSPHRVFMQVLAAKMLFAD